MKCPKCGSENTVGKIEKGYCYCNNCKSRIDRYQIRLDKVLSKFENGTLYVIDGVTIFYEQNEFSLVSGDGYSYDEIVISLDTVESLLKDLEVDKK